VPLDIGSGFGVGVVAGDGDGLTDGDGDGKVVSLESCWANEFAVKNKYRQSKRIEIRN
jgi:hypothetical protein